MKKLINKSVHGDTIIEVMISLAIFSAVALLTINLMNSSINTAQTTLESTMARAALDAQAETLRFIHNSYVSERNRSGQDKQFSGLWKALISKGLNTESLSDRLLVQKALANLDI